MIDILLTNERALVAKSPEIRSYLESYLGYQVTSCKVDIPATRREKRTVYKWSIEDRSHLIDDGTPFYTIPRGLAEMLPRDEFNFIDETSHNIEVPQDLSDEYVKNVLSSDYILRDDQVSSVQKSLYYKRGINQLATGSGKSIIICAIIKILIEYNPDIRILLIVPYDHLKRTFSEYFSKFGISHEICPNLSYDKNVTISSPISILNRPENFPRFGAVIYDEVQHLSSTTWTEVSLKLINAEIALGFSAQVVDKKNIFTTRIENLSELEAKVIGAVGKVISYVPPSRFIDQGVLATPVLLSVNNYLDDILLEEQSWSRSQKIGLLDDSRIRYIAHISRMFSSNGRRVLILAATHEQSFVIAQKIIDQDPNIVVGISHGGNKGYIYTDDHYGYKVDKLEGSEVISKFKNNEISIIIGTSHLDEGVDLPSLDACILAGAGKNSRRLIQRVGRCLRVTKTGKYAYIVDFVDNNSKILHKHYLRRVDTYISEIGISPDRLYKSLSIEQVSHVFKRLEGIE